MQLKRVSIKFLWILIYYSLQFAYIESFDDIFFRRNKELIPIETVRSEKKIKFNNFT
jgi:hypothetical protein